MVYNVNMDKLSNMIEPSIVVSGLSKRYGNSDNIALNNLTISVHPGEVYGFLGPNGAGKSTAIRLLMNLIQPTSGQATILGHDVVNDSVKIKNFVGYLSSDVTMYPKMTGRQFLEYMNDLQPAKSRSYMNELCKRLRADLDKHLSDLSRGNRQKIAIIQAFMHQPKILILDEPTSGLDPLMQEEFYKFVAEAKQRGATIFVSSHILSEVQKMCDRVGIIREGKLVTERNIGAMASEAAHTFDINFASKAPVSEIKKIKGVRVVSHDGNSVTVHLRGKLNPLFAILSKHEVLSIDVRNLDLEEVFMHFYKDSGASK